MAKQGTLTVRILSDTKQAEAGLKQFESRVQSTGDKLSSAGQKMTMFATVPIAAALGVATKAASNLQQAVGGTEAVFGDASDAIDEFGKKSATVTGLSEREFREATTSIGGQLKRMTGDVDLAAEQSIELTKVAADLAATYGGTTAEAVAALGSAFRGEADPAERFNLNLKQGAVNAKAVELGLAATTNEVDENAKAQATLALIMEQSADAQGQFARESGSAAGSMQIAKAQMEEASAEIGSALLPLVANLAGGVAELAEKFSSLPKPIQNGVVAIAGLVAASGPVLTMAGNVGKLVEKARGVDNLSGSLAGLAKNAAAVGVAGLAVGKLVDTIGDAMDDAKDDGEAMAESYLTSFNTATDTLEDVHNRIIGINKEIAARRDAADDAWNPATAERHNKMADALQQEADQLLKAEAAASKLQAELGVTADEAWRMANNADVMAEATDDATGEIDGAAAAAAQAAEDTKDYADSIKGVADAHRAAINPLFAAQDAMLKIGEAQREAEQANWEVLAAQEALTTAVNTFGKDSPEATRAAWDLTEAQRDAEQASRDAAGAALDYDVALLDLKAAVTENAGALDHSIDTLDRWVDEGKITEAQAKLMKDELNLAALAAHYLDEQSITPEVQLLGYEKTILQLMALNDLASGLRGSFGYRAAVAAATAPERHTGGPVHAGYPYLVGRPGAEELFVPGQSGQVLSGATTDRVRSSGSGGGDMTLAVLSTLKSIERKIESTTVNLDGHAVGTMTRREADFHALRNAV